MSATAYERIVDKLHELDLRPRPGYQSTTARCPSHDDRNASLAVYDKDGKAKVVCFAGCDDALDILSALEMTVADLYDEKRSGIHRAHSKYSEQAARYQARKTMTAPEKALDDLLHMPDFAERLCKTIGRIRPELYLIDKHQLEPTTNAALLTDTGYRHVAHLLGGGIHG